MIKKAKAEIFGINWNAYRKYYDFLNFAEIQELHDLWARRVSVAPRFSVKQMEKVFSKIETEKNPMSVVELGCCMGGLAQSMLEKFSSIESWIGCDITKDYLIRTKTRDKRYKRFLLKNWFYSVPLPKFDVFVSSHTMEHLNQSQFYLTLRKASEGKYIVLDIPLPKDGTDWNDRKSAHIFSGSRDDVRQGLRLLGYESFYETQSEISWITAWRNVKP